MTHQTPKLHMQLSGNDYVEFVKVNNIDTEQANKRNNQNSKDKKTRI